MHERRNKPSEKGTELPNRLHSMFEHVEEFKDWTNQKSTVIENRFLVQLCLEINKTIKKDYPKDFHIRIAINPEIYVALLEIFLAVTNDPCESVCSALV